MANKEYFAFISYKSDDEEWAIWLQHELEHYHLPTSFNGRMDVRKDLRPIFRDIDELSAGNLPEQIQTALINSQNLIVICSPKAASSPWVNKEIETFIKLGRINRIFPFIVDGVFPNEFFPPVLLGIPESEERLGGDVRKKGRDAAFVKIVAGMLDVDFDSLWNRYEKEKAEEERKQREQRENLLRLRSRAVAEKVLGLIEEGDYYTARLLALQILPTPNNPDYPYTPEAEYALRQSMQKDSAILRGHTSRVNYASISADNKYIASISNDRTIKIWKALNGELIHSIDGAFYFVEFVSFSPDSKQIVSVEDSWAKGQLIKIWDVQSGRLDKEIKYPSSINFVKFAPTGHKIIIASFDDFCVYDLCLDEISFLEVCHSSFYKTVVDGKEVDAYNPMIRDGHTLMINFADCSPSENRVVSASNDGTAYIWNTKNGKNLFVLRGHTGAVDSAEYSSDGKFIITVSRDDTARIWSSKKGQPIIIFDKRKVNTASFSPDARIIVSATHEKSIITWDANKGKIIGEYKGHEGRINSTIFSSDGKQIVSASNDFTVRLWDTLTERSMKTLFGHEKTVTSADFSPDGKFIVSCSADGQVFIWDTTNWTRRRICFSCSDYKLFDDKWHEMRTRFTSVVFSPDGKKILVASNDYMVRVIDIATSAISLSFKVKQETPNYLNINTANYSHDGLLFVTSSDNHTIKVWDAKTGANVITINENTPGSLIGHIMCTVFNYDNSLIASAGGDKIQIRCLQDNSIYCTFDGHSDCVNCLQFTHDDKYLVSVSNDHTIKIWDIKDKVIINTIYPHNEEIHHISISPDDRLIATASSDKLIKVWDLKSGCLLETLSGHKDEVTSVTFSPDGRTIMSTSHDSTIKIWELKPLNELVEDAIRKCDDRQLTSEEKRLYYIE